MLMRWVAHLKSVLTDVGRIICYSTAGKASGQRAHLSWVWEDV